jgi:hypothetical protein
MADPDVGRNRPHNRMRLMLTGIWLGWAVMPKWWYMMTGLFLVSVIAWTAVAVWYVSSGSPSLTHLPCSEPSTSSHYSSSCLEATGEVTHTCR